MTDFWRDRPVLVTGATGLLGGWLVKRLLAEGADVTCIVRTETPHSELFRSADHLHATLVGIDVRDSDLMTRVVLEDQIDVVFHTAAVTQVGVSGRDPTTTWGTNVGGTVSVLEACRRGKVSAVVVASSDKAYGDHGKRAVTEGDPLLASAPYDASKACADMIARSYASSFGLPVAVTRCGNLYGGGDLNWNRVVPGTIRSVLRGQRPVLRSDGTMVRDYLYVDDAVDAYLLLAEHLAALDPLVEGSAFNFSGGDSKSVRQMVEGILGTMDSGLDYVVGTSKPAGEIPYQVLSSSKAKSVLGWEPKVEMVEGLRKTVEWYRELLK